MLDLAQEVYALIFVTPVQVICITVLCSRSKFASSGIPKSTDELLLRAGLDIVLVRRSSLPPSVGTVMSKTTNGNAAVTAVYIVTNCLAEAMA